MLVDYLTEQPIGCKMIQNEFKKNVISHAYIIETNGYSKGYNFAVSFAKSLLCPQNKIEKTLCGQCTQCKKIDDFNYTELEIIEPDGLTIKKEQLDKLQKKFNSKAIEGNKKVYIINHADKLNESSSNSILKFLEEPEPNIIAILVVDNCFNLLDTIISRCQIIKLVNNYQKSVDEIQNICSYLFNNNEEIENFKNINTNNNIIENTIGFIKLYEKIGVHIILKENKFCADFIKDKKLFNYFINIMLFFYKDVMNYKLFKTTDVFNKKIPEDIIYISEKYSIEEISQKIKIILKIQDRIKNNCNLNLLLDKLILLLEGE